MLTPINATHSLKPVEPVHIPEVRSKSDNPIINATRELTEKSKKLPGIAQDASPAAVQQHRNELLTCLDALDKTGCWDYQQDDQSIRPVAVGLQALFEQALLDSLENGTVLQADIIFTTANPLTPLCQPVGMSSSSMVSTSVASHPGSKDTVISRTFTMPRLLDHPSVNICTLYSQKRANPVDQSYYDDMCLAHPDGNKFYSLCTEQPLPEELSGANYVVVSKDFSTHFFGVRITQANKETDNCVIFTQDAQQRLKQLCENYLENVLLQHPVDRVLNKFIDLLRQNY